MKKPRPLAPSINDSMLSHESWKIFQVIAEFVEGYERLIHIRPSVSIFGSARSKTNSKYYKLAYDVSKKFSDAGFSVVTGGGPGIMEAANKGAYAGRSFSIGLNIVLPMEEQSNPFQDIVLRFRHFFTRKVMFVKYASAYLVLPGGFGTLNELSEILSLIQTKKTKKIPVILMGSAYWKDLISWFQNTLVAGKYIKASDIKLFHLVDDPSEALAIVKNFYKKHSPKGHKRLGPKDFDVFQDI